MLYLPDPGVHPDPSRSPGSPDPREGWGAGSSTLVFCALEPVLTLIKGLRSPSAAARHFH